MTDARQESANRRCIETTRRGHGIGYFNLLIVREGNRIVLYPHAVADLAIELDAVAADALVTAVTELLLELPSTSRTTVTGRSPTSPR